MSFVITAPEALAAAASDIAGIGSMVDTANAAAGSTTRVAAMATDEVSAAIAALFGTHAQEYQAASAQVAQFHAQFVRDLTAGAGWYASAETASASALQRVVQGALSLLSGAAGSGGQARSAEAVSPKSSDTTSGGDSTSTSTTTTTSSTTPASSPGATTTPATSTTSASTPSGPTPAAGTSGTTTTPTATATSASTPSGATALAATAGTGDTGGSGLTATYATSSQWNNGFVANYTITNTGTTPMSNWQLQFNMPANESITNMWNGHVVQSGTQYTVTPESYNGTIAPGHSVTVGFQASQNGTYSAPTNLLVN